MFYKSSILTATFVMLSVSNAIFLERGYANASEISTDRDSASDYELETSSLITAPKPEKLKAKLDPLDIDRISKNTKLDPVVNTWGNVVINPDLPPVQPTSLFAKGDDSHSKQQVKHLAQLVDVEPTDWEFQSLKALNERYNCLVGDGDTFKDSQGLTREEFAASLKICLDRIDKSIASSNTKLASNDDLETLKRLQEEFAPELANLRKRADSLDARVATLESQQFSPTTRLFGQAIIGVQGRSSNQADVFPRDGIRETQDPGTNLNLINTVQLNLLTQFENRSFLLAGFQTGSGSTFPSSTNNTRLAYESPTNGNLILSDLTYRFPVTDKFAGYVGTVGVNPVTAFRGPNRVASAGAGPISFFAQRNPILNIGYGSAGAGFDWQFAEKASIQSVYAATTASNPAAGNGLFNGGYVMGTQLVVTPVPPVDISLYYLNSYSTLGFLGTGTGDDQLVPLTGQAAPLMTHAVGTTINWQLNPKLTMGGWLGYTNSSVPSLPGSVETINWMAYLNFPNLFGRGNLGGIYVGQPPKITSSNLPTGLNIPNLFKNLSGTPGGQPGTTTHLEAFYRWQVADNISITPGILFIFQPRHTRDSDTITEMAIRATFTF
jgi:Carbohydrate-selective porin, OprB family